MYGYLWSQQTKYVWLSMSPLSMQQPHKKRSKQRFSQFHKAMIARACVASILVSVVISCGSTKNQASPSQSTVLNSLTSEEPPASSPFSESTLSASPKQTTNSARPNPVIGQGVPPTSAAQSNGQSPTAASQSPMVTNSTLAQQNTVPTTTPRFIPFECSVSIRETSQRPSPNTSAIRVDVVVKEKTQSVVWVEATSEDLRDRKAVSISQTNSGSTQLVVRYGKGATVTVYASSDFQPDARMCSDTR